MTRVEGEGLVKTRQGLFVSLHRQQHGAEIGMGVGVTGLGGNGPADQFQRRFVLAGGERDGAKQAQGFGVFGLGRQDPAVDFLGFPETAGAVMIDGCIEVVTGVCM